VTDIDPRAERDLDDRLRDLAQTRAPLPAETRDAVKRRVLAALDAAPVETAAHAVEADPFARERRRKRRWLAGGIAAAAIAAAAAVAVALWGIEREVAHHSRSAASGSVPRPVPAPAPPVAHTVRPQNIPPSMLEEQRVAGEKMIFPDDGTKSAIAASGKDKIVASEKICVNLLGEVYSIQLLKSTGFPAYDMKIAIEISQWRYKPQPVEVCTAVTFIYSQK